MVSRMPMRRVAEAAGNGRLTLRSLVKDKKQ